jgi:hypothetical protein
MIILNHHRGLMNYDVTRTGRISYDPYSEKDYKIEKRFKEINKNNDLLKRYIDKLNKGYPSYEAGKRWMSFYWLDDREKAMEYFRAAQNPKKFRINFDTGAITTFHEYNSVLDPLESERHLHNVPPPVYSNVKRREWKGTTRQIEDKKYTRKEYILKVIDKKLPVRINHDDWIANCVSWAITIELAKIDEPRLLKQLWDEVIWWADPELAVELDIPHPDKLYLKYKH